MSLSSLVMTAGRSKQGGNANNLVDIITFIESEWGLGMKLFPVQRVILKAHYGLELDDNPYGFPMDVPIPLDHPHYSDDLIDLKPRSAVAIIEVLDPSNIPVNSELRLQDHTGHTVLLKEGVHWSKAGSVEDVVASIVDAINANVLLAFECNGGFAYGSIELASKGSSTEGNEARITLTKCSGFRVGMPPLEFDQNGYETHSHRFFGGEGGFYKNRIAISDWRRENHQVFTEAGYLAWLFDQGRCNVREIIPGHERREMVLSIGRRSGKTLITSCILAYETYKLLSKENPQMYYGSSQSNIIQLISVATDKDQAGLLYQEASGHFQKCDFFRAYAANATQTFATFQTPHDINRYGSYSENNKARYSVKVTFRSCVAKGLRGGANILVALDEVAHFTDAGQSSADEVYQAVEPSTRTFSPKDPQNTTRPVGENEGRIIMISSPLGKQGLFYKQFNIGFTSGQAANNMLCIQAPTWEVNPTVPAGTFESSYLKDPRVFYTEFGAEFTDRTRGWLEDEVDLRACIDPELRPKGKAPPRAPHFMGVDVGIVGDATAVAIGHLEEDGTIVLDYIDKIKAGEGDYADQHRLDFDGISDWISNLAKKFYIHKGMFDQHAGIPLEQSLAKKGLKQFEAVHHTRTLNSHLFENFKNMMYDRRLALYNWPIPDTEGADLCEYLQELTELQAEVVSKHITLVEAPPVEGKHDDLSDALMRMVWLATNHKNKIIAFAGRQASLKGKGQSPGNLAKSARRRLAGGSDPKRQVVSGGRFRPPLGGNGGGGWSR